MRRRAANDELTILITPELELAIFRGYRQQVIQSPEHKPNDHHTFPPMNRPHCDAKVVVRSIQGCFLSFRGFVECAVYEKTMTTTDISESSILLLSQESVV